MPSLNFTKFTDKILSGEKRQTIRLSRKHPIKRGDKLYLYTGMRTKNCKKLGEAVCSEVVPIKIQCLKDARCSNEIKITPPLEASAYVDLSKADGFKSLFDFNKFFITTYKLKPWDSKDFIIIKWRDFVPTGEG